MVAVVVVVLDKGTDLPFQVARQEVVFQQNPVLHGLVPTLDLALGLGMMRCATNMIHALGAEPTPIWGSSGRGMKSCCAIEGPSIHISSRFKEDRDVLWRSLLSGDMQMLSSGVAHRICGSP